MVHAVQVASIHMGQIRLMVFARNDIYASITSVRTAKQATGVAGVATNKGGVSVSLKVGCAARRPHAALRCATRAHA